MRIGGRGNGETGWVGEGEAGVSKPSYCLQNKLPAKFRELIYTRVRLPDIYLFTDI